MQTSTLIDQDAERRLLCGAILDPARLPAILDGGLAREDFSDPRHGLIWQALADQWLAGRIGDSAIVAVAESLTVAGKLDAVGGPAYLGDVVDYVPTAFVASPERAAAHVLDLARRRRIRREVELLYEEASAPGHTADTLTDRFLSVALALTGTRQAASACTIAQAVAEALDGIDGTQGDEPGVVPLPWYDLAHVLNLGLRPGKLYIVAARPAMGKSVMGLQMATHAARHGHGAAVFSAEMEAVELAQRVIASESSVGLGHITRRSVTRYDDLQRARSVEHTVAGWPLVLDCGPLTLEHVVSRSKALRAAGRCDLVVVDYIQLLSSSRKSRAGNREQEIAEYSRGLKRLATELHVPVVALSQLNRGLEQRQDKRPTLSDLRESGAIEQDADAVIMLYRPSVYAAPGTREADDTSMEAIVRKQRGGATGTVALVFDGPYTRILGAQ